MGTPIDWVCNKSMSMQKDDLRSRCEASRGEHKKRLTLSDHARGPIVVGDEVNREEDHASAIERRETTGGWHAAIRPRIVRGIGCIGPALDLRCRLRREVRRSSRHA